MTVLSRILSASILTLPCLVQAYTLKTDYIGNNADGFFDKFTFWTTDDLTGGYVDYVGKDTAQSQGLISANDGTVYLGVDSRWKATGRGRMSLRLTSTETYNPGTLFVADVAHMPDTCGTWPAFWTTSSSHWPDEGEIDIIENANNAAQNQMSLHVSENQGQCKIAPNPPMKAQKDRWDNCLEEQTGGCDANDNNAKAFGRGFNDNKGGVYAMEWTGDHVHIWFWERQDVPTDNNGPLGQSPNPSTWGTPITAFDSENGTGCDMTKHIKNQRIVINTDLCGRWAEGTWGNGCKQVTGKKTCKEYVRDVPQDFSTAYWTFNSLKVYT